MDKEIWVLCAMWYGFIPQGQTATLGTFTTREKAEAFLELFKAGDTGHNQYGEYFISEERVDPEYHRLGSH